MFLSLILATLVRLSGVTGEDLSARAYFDVNNVKVGDPLVLTVDFVGSADFEALHPPALSRCVNSRDWKLDDKSAKTDTYRDARRLTYRVRPMREGVLWFPAIEFEYVNAAGSNQVVRSNEIPVHAKMGAQVVVEEMGEDSNEMPNPAQLSSIAPDDLCEDERFAWRKACANPSSAAFAKFDFPAAKMNEAFCYIREGSWAKALGVYRRLEWTTGQTQEIERGIIAALALKYDNPHIELPVWRQVLRPILRYGWQGRIGILVGALSLVVLVFFALSRTIRAVASLAIMMVFASSLNAQDIFQQMHEQMQRMHEQMQNQMQQMSSGFSFNFGGGQEEKPNISATLAMDTEEPQVGDAFNFIVALKVPRNCSVSQLHLTPSELFGLTFAGETSNLEDESSSDPSNVIKRIAIPVRYNIPFGGKVSFRIEGMTSGRKTRNNGRFSFTFSNSFSCTTPAVTVKVRPLSGVNQPQDFGGVISSGIRIHEYPDILSVETNDVIKITYRMVSRGYVPPRYMPENVAFESSRRQVENGETEVEYVRYFVADGAKATPALSLSYYDPRKRRYVRISTGETPIKYLEDNHGAKTN